MLTIREIEQQLHVKKWNIKVYDSFIYENMYPKLNGIVKNDEEVLSMLWSTSSDSKGKTGSVFELFLLTNERILNLSADSKQSPEEIKTRELDLDLIQYITLEPSNFNHGAFRINIVYGSEIIIVESIDEPSSQHMVNSINELIELRKEVESETISLEEELESFEDFNLNKTMNTSKGKAKSEKTIILKSPNKAYFSEDKLKPKNSTSFTAKLSLIAVILIIASAIDSSVSFSQIGSLKVSKILLIAVGIALLIMTIIGLTISILYSRKYINFSNIVISKFSIFGFTQFSFWLWNAILSIIILANASTANSMGYFIGPAIVLDIVIVCYSIVMFTIELSVQPEQVEQN